MSALESRREEEGVLAAYSQVVKEVAVVTFGAPGRVMFNRLRKVGVKVAEETILVDVTVSTDAESRLDG